MSKLIVLLVIMLSIGIVVTTFYLTPDDLKNCDISPSEQMPCKKADAIVTISGGNTPARTQEAIELYQSGWANAMVFSGAAADTTGPSNAEVMRLQAIKAGVPSSAILIESVSQTTKQNADQTQQLLESNSIKRVILVTSPYHQRRASLEFHARVGDGIAIVNHPTTHDTTWSKFWWLSPRGWWLSVGEVVKIIAFYTGQSQ